MVTCDLEGSRPIHRTRPHTPLPEEVSAESLRSCVRICHSKPLHISYHNPEVNSPRRAHPSDKWHHTRQIIHALHLERSCIHRSSQCHRRNPCCHRVKFHSTPTPFTTYGCIACEIAWSIQGSLRIISGNERLSTFPNGAIFNYIIILSPGM
jgi:hypothetical protein